MRPVIAFMSIIVFLPISLCACDNSAQIAARNQFAQIAARNQQVLAPPDPTVACGPLGRYANVPAGTVFEEFKNQGVWLLRTPNRLVAISVLCTHLGCMPNWIAGDRQFKCPCDGSTFAPDGLNLTGPAPRPLDRFAIRLVNGNVEVDRSKKFPATKDSQVAWDEPAAAVVIPVRQRATMKTQPMPGAGGS